MIKRIARFIVKVLNATKRVVFDFVRGCWMHAETIAVLTLASFGATALIGELPFYATLPMWFEQTMVVPVLAVVFVMLLIRLAEWRAKRRMIYGTA